ncbi:hypothetical protein ACTJI8_02895 [Microbacterium sp. 22303]|uniref:hypothetical protein n=1 Tax=Microbacterium sp. 22303 TaxID=3453905 RepID=UPI003F8536AA
MSEETKAEIDRARTALGEAQTHASAVKRSALESIASNMPAKVDAIAKRIAHEYPEVTRELGADRVAQLREDLAKEAKRLGDQFVGAIDEINWPRSEPYSQVRSQDIESALTARFRGKVNGPSDILARAGYLKTNLYHREAVQTRPRELFDGEDFGPVAEALTALSKAEDSFKKALAADDRAVVNDLWGD